MHRLLDRYTAAICRESPRLHGAQSRLLAVLLKKRALSSAASLGVSVRRRLDLLTGAPAPAQLPLALDDEDPLADDVDDGVLAAPGLRDDGAERTLLNRIARAADAAGVESKLTFLVRLLRRVREPAIVFTEYRDTLARLHGPLAATGHAVTLLHGGQLPAERAAAQHRFNDTGGVLLATDAASEGLNLHTRCRVVIHYELPWTPSRLEQRAGRVDRIGQPKRVHELLLVAGDPAERLVLAPLARRAARARSALGPSGNLLDHVTETTVGERILNRGVHGPRGSPESDDHGLHGVHGSPESDDHGLHGGKARKSPESDDHGLHGIHGSPESDDHGLHGYTDHRNRTTTDYTRIHGSPESDDHGLHGYTDHRNRTTTDYTEYTDHRSRTTTDYTEYTDHRSRTTTDYTDTRITGIGRLAAGYRYASRNEIRADRGRPPERGGC